MTIGGTATTIEITVMSVPVEDEGAARVVARDSSATHDSPAFRHACSPAESRSWRIDSKKLAI
jgi:hypothetical protein